jgi:hypothetical protein
MELEDCIIAVYVRLDQIYHELTRDRPLRRGGFAPSLSDVEVLTMEIIGEMEGRNGDRAIWRYFQEHWGHWFPRLGAYKTFAKQCANLCWICQEILRRLFDTKDTIHIIDGVPLPLCHNARASRTVMLKDVAAWGFCAAKDEHYWGLRGHLVLAMSGTITACVVTSANIDERQALWDITDKIKGLLLGDKGFIGEQWQHDMAACGIDLQTPLRDNMQDKRPKHAVRTLLRVRKKIETALSLLTQLFHLTKIKAHNLWHYTSKLTRKLLAYNFYITLKC